MKKKDENVTIVFHSSNTGSISSNDPESFAKQISNDLPNTTIIAPTTAMVVESNGENERAATVSLDKNGKYIGEEAGKYVEYQKGEITNYYSGDAKVGSKGFNDNFLKKATNFIKSIIN